MPVGITMELNYCRKCIQMTNHFRQTYHYPEEKIILHCLKCRLREGKVRITDFNKDMHEEEREYYGEEYDDMR